MSPASIRNRGVHGYEQGCTLHGFPACVGIFSTKEIPTSFTDNAKAIHLHLFTACMLTSDRQSGLRYV